MRNINHVLRHFTSPIQSHVPKLDTVSESFLVNGVRVSHKYHRRGAIAVIARADQLLVIERSAKVVAPGSLCFPGGAIESGETEPIAVVREVREELNVAVRPLRRIWRSAAPAGIELNWWQAELLPGEQPMPNPAEVADVFWMNPKQMAKDARLLPTNRQFLEALGTGAFALQ